MLVAALCWCLGKDVNPVWGHHLIPIITPNTLVCMHLCFAGDKEYTTLKFRSGTQVDSTSLALILDSAGRRLPSYFWSLYADDGQSFFEFGREKIRTETEANSYCCNWHIGESDNKFIGAFYGFSVENPYPEIDYEKEPNWWTPYLELEQRAAGSWLLHIVSILPEYRGQGYAKAFLTYAEQVAKKEGAKKITLQVEEINQIALKTYIKNDYLEVDRRKITPFPFSKDTGDIILMEKSL